MKADEKGNIEPDKSDKPIPCTGNAEAGSVSNSSVVTSITSEVSSSGDVGFESVGGSSDGNTGSVEGSNILGISQGDSCEADSELLLENGCVNAKEGFQDGLHEELEPNAALGIVLKSRGGVDSEPVPKSVLSRLSLTSTA